MKKIIQKLANKAICAAFVVLGAFAASAELVKTPILDDAGVSVGYKVTGLENGEVAMVYTNHERTATWTVPYDIENVEFLVVGGGGAGGGGSKRQHSNGTVYEGGGGAGGGGGGVVTGLVNFVKNQEVLIKIGKGGLGGKYTDSYAEGSGAATRGAEPTIVTVGETIRCIEAGAGGSDAGYKNAGGQGASNAGSRKKTVNIEVKSDAFYVNPEFVTISKTYGHIGGVATRDDIPFSGGGGGGANGIGGTAGVSGTYDAGDGGVGLTSRITGENVVYGAGGGGGAGFGNGGKGGIGGGTNDSGAGNGGNPSGTASKGSDGGPGLANQGGGGGGAGKYGNGGNGGSGIVVFRYVEKLAPEKPVVDNLTYTGSELVGVSGEGFTVVSGTVAATEVGTYTAVLSPEDGAWADGTEGNYEVTWKIWPRMPEASMVAAENGYIARGLGDNGNEVAVVFTNENATAISWKAPSAINNAQFLVVGGGGGGGADNRTDERSLGGAGGGGGGVVTGSVPLSDSDIISVTVGGGGLGGAVNENPAGETGALGASYAGANSVVTINNAEDFYVVAFGGGRDNGAKSEAKYIDGNVGGVGGSNGGNKSRVATAQDEPLKGQIQGSRSCTNGETLGSKGGVSSNSSEYASHGGGGACGAGVDYNGGEGYESSITGRALVYGSGGGGGKAGSSGGVGGTGAGNGNLSRAEVYGFDALPNQGGGGGGSGGGEGLAVGTKTGGNGGSGIVAFRFAYPEVASVDGLGYLNLVDALTAADESESKTLTLMADVDAVELSSTLTLKTDVYSVETITLTDVNAVLTADKGLNVITTVANSEVKFENGVYTVVASVFTIALPTVENATWSYNGTPVTGPITVNKGTNVEFTLKAADGYQFANGQTSVTVTFNSVNDNIAADNSAFASITAPQKPAVAKIGEQTFETLEAAVAAVADNTATTITLIDNVTLAETLTIPAGKTVTLDLNGKTVSHTDEANKYAINNLGTLTLKDSKGNGSINARGIYNGYGNGGDNVATAKITVESGTYNAKGTNGGAAIYNYGEAYINGGNFTSIGGYSLNNQSGSSMTIGNGAATVTANNGIYCSGATLTVNSGDIDGNRSGCHVLYAWNSTVTINGGDFYNNNSGNSTLMAAGTTKMTVNGGTFGIKDGRVSGNGNTWTSCLTDTQNTASLIVNGGTFNGGFRVQANTTMTINGGEFNDVGGSGYNIDGTASVKGGTFADAAAVKFATTYLAPDYKIGDDGKVVAIPVLPAYVVLPDGVTNANYEEKFGANTVTDGTTYYATLQKAVEAVCGTAGATLYCKPGADVGSLQHAPVTASLTVYGNGASVTGGAERDFDIGNTDPSGGKDITADMTLTVKDLAGCGAWGSKATSHTVNLVFEGCQNMGKVFITGTTGTLNITIKDSSFEGVIKEAVYSNADGAITLNKVAFSDLTKAVNLNHKAAGTQTVTIQDCSFVNCGADVSADQIPVRVLSSVEGGKSVLTVSGTTFTGTPAGGADILLDYGVGDTVATVANTAANVAVEKTENVATTTTTTAGGEVAEFTNVITVAQIGEAKFKTFAEALSAASAMEGDVTVTVLEKVTLNGPLSGKYASIKFVGGNENAEIYLDVQGYIEAVGKNVAFENLKLSKVAGGYVANAGFMNLAFGIYGATEVIYTNCTFLNGAYASSGKNTFTGCNFYRSHDRYGLWAYGAQNIVVDDCTFADIRGIKMYDEGKFGTTSITVKDTSFAAVTDKPAIVLTYGNSVTLENNTYNADKGTFELDLGGKPNGVTVTSDVAPTCVNDNGACGVLVDGKIYTTVAQAAEVATATSTVTLLHNSAETVVLPIGVTLNKNGFEAAGITVAQPVAMIGEKGYASLQAAINAVQNGETITFVADIAEDVTLTEKTGLYYTIDGLGKKMNGTITISSLSDTHDNRRITIKNINFVTTTGRDFITSTATNHYPRLTVEGCTFTGTGAALADTVAIRLKSSYSVVIKDCTGTGLHSFIQNTAGWNLTIENVTVSDSKSGFALGTVQGVTVKDCEIEVAGYGIRMDAQYNNNAVLESNKVSAFIPVVVRKASVDSNVTVTGSNSMTATNTDDLWFAAGTSEYETSGTMPTAPTGKVVVTLNDTGLNAAGVYGNYGVAVVNGVKYVTLKDAVAAVADGGTIVLVANETFTANNRAYNSGTWYDGLYYVGDKSFTIDLGGFTIGQDGAVNDYLLNFKNAGAKENTITLKNGTIDAGTAAYCAICTYSTSTQKITINLERINVINNNSYGSTIKVRGGAELNVKSGAKITGKNSYLAIECVASTVNIYDGAEIYMNGKSSYLGCLVGACGNGVVNVYGGYGEGVKGGFIAMTSGGTINVFGGEWIANTDGTIGDNSNVYVLTAQNNNKESGYAGASIINVTGGTFRGGMDAWILNDANVEKAELNIAGGNFNANPTTYLDEGYVVNEANGVYTVAKAVAKIGEDYYTTLEEAFKAATSDCTIDILSDVTIDYKWDCRDYATGGSHSQFKESVTINGNGYTLKFTGSISDGNWNTIFRFEENATVNNLTVDISEATGAQRVISAKKSLTVDRLTIIGSARYGIIFGEGASAADLAAAEIVVTNSTLTGTRRAISDNERGEDVKSVVITGNTLKANAYASASESITFNNNIATGEVDLRSYTAENVLSVEAKDNTLNAGVKNYIYAKNIDAQEGFTTKRPPFKVTTKAELDAAVAAVQDGDVIELLADITTDAVIVIDDDITINGNNKTITSSANRVIRIAADVTINDVNMVSKAVRVGTNDIRGVSVDYYTANDDFDLVLNNCSVDFTDATATDWAYAVNQSGNDSTGNSITIIGGTYEGANVININGTGHTVTIDGATLISTYAYNSKYYGLCVSFNDGASTAEIKNTTFAGTHAKPIKYKGSTVAEENNTDNTELSLEGSGTEAKPFLIKSIDDLVLFRDSVNAGKTKYNAPGVWVVLAADIDMAGITWERGIGDGINATYDGIFDGNGKTIKNVTLAPTADSDKYFCGGLFGYTYGNVVIKNMTIENITVTANGEGHNVGALVGFAYNKGGKLNVSNVTVKGDIVIAAAGTYGVGTIVGYSYFDMGVIENCQVIGNDGSYIEGYSFVGGITGYSYSNAQIKNCSVENVTITATSKFVGGIAGIIGDKTTISGCTAEAKISGTACKGSIVGAISGNGLSLTLENCTATGSLPEIGGNYSDDAAVVAKVGNKYYTTFAEAYAMVQAGDTITLLDDVTLTGKLTIAKDVTIDGNGHSIIANHTPFILETSSDCEFKNITLNTNNKAKGVKIASGNVIFDNVTIPNSNKSDAITVYGMLTIKNYFKVESTYQVFDARKGSIYVEEGTVFDFTSRIGLASPADDDLKAAVDTNGKPYFCAYGSTTYYKNFSSVATTITDLTLLDNVELNSNLSVKGTLDLNGKTLTLAEGKVLKTGGNLTIINEATFVGPIELTSASYTVTAPDGLNVITNVEGMKVVYENGVYKLADIVYAAQIGEQKYETLASALAAAQNDAVVELLWADGDAPIAMNGSVFGKSVTITGTATVDWSKGFLFVGRGGEGNGTVIFDNANLESASNNASYGIHVSGREKNTNNKYDGTVVINNSTIVLDYLIDKGAMTMTNSMLTVKNGFAVGGRPASETESGADATATFDLTNGSTLIVNNHNGMGLGYEAIGVMTIDSTSTFECTQSFLVTDKGVLKSAGNVFGDIVKSDNAQVELAGGIYTDEEVQGWCADGYVALRNFEDQYVVGVAPTAEVENLGATTVAAGGYAVATPFGGSSSNAEPMELPFVMKYVAVETPEAGAASPYADWYGDFVITFSGLKNGSISGAGCYLAGHYGTFGWVKVPVDNLTIENGVRYPVMLSTLGNGQKYDYICSGVDTFLCAMYLPESVLAENPDLKVSLELCVVDNANGPEAAQQALATANSVYTYQSAVKEFEVEDFEEKVQLPEVEVVDIKSMLTDADPDLTFALNFAIKDVDKLSKEYLEKLFAKYGDYYTDYVLTISGLTDSNGSVKFNANGNGDGYLAGQYDAWSKSWVTVPFSDVTVKNGQSFYIMEYAAELMNKGGLRLTLKEIAEIVKNFDCGVYFTPEFLAANPNLKVDLELKVFTEDENGNKVGDISVATNTFDKDDFSVEAAKLDIRIVNGKPQIGFAGEGELVLNAATALTGEWTKNIEYTAVENDGDDTKTWVTPKDGYYFFKGYIVR